MFGIQLLTWGEYACFTRPEMRAERVSYDVMTPSAARGLIESIYWKPEIRWVIDRIHVLAPISFTSIRRNEVGTTSNSGHKVSKDKLKARMEGGSEPLCVNIEDARVQRSSLILKNVRYGIEAHFEIKDGSSPGKHLDIFNRRARNGQSFKTPCFGCREFAANFEVPENAFPSCPDELKGQRDLGFMLHDIDFANGNTPRFYRAKMSDGIIDVQACLANPTLC